MKVGRETFCLLLSRELMLSWRSNWNRGPKVLTHLVEAPGCSTKPICLWGGMHEVTQTAVPEGVATGSVMVGVWRTPLPTVQYAHHSIITAVQL